MVKTNQQIFLKMFREKYISVVVGIFVVIIGFVLLERSPLFVKLKNDKASGFDKKNQTITNMVKKNIDNGSESSTSGQIDMQAAATTQVVSTTNIYTVGAGDTLSIISQKVYGDMFMWERIATANNIQDVNNIEEGTVLKIPRD